MTPSVAEAPIPFDFTGECGYLKCKLCGRTVAPADECGYCECCERGMARTNGD